MAVKQVEELRISIPDVVKVKTTTIDPTKTQGVRLRALLGDIVDTYAHLLDIYESTALDNINTITNTIQESVTSLSNSFTEAKIEVTDFLATQVIASINGIIDGSPIDGNTLLKLNSKIETIMSLMSSDSVDMEAIQSMLDSLSTNESLIATISSSKINVLDIYNDLDYLIEGKVLDARQGKILVDSINSIGSLITILDSNIQNKVDKILGKSLSTNDYSNEDKTKLHNLPLSYFSGNYSELSNLPIIPTKTSELNNDSNFITTIPLIPNYSAGIGLTKTGTDSSPIFNVDSTQFMSITNANTAISTMQEDINGKVSSSRSITINGLTQTLGADRSWTLTYGWLSITGKPNFSTVATTGSYNDLLDKPSFTTKRIETYSGITNASGIYTVVFSTPYTVAPNIQANLIGGSALSGIIITSISTTGFTITAYTRSTVSSLPIVGTLTAALIGTATTALVGGNIDVLITSK